MKIQENREILIVSLYYKHFKYLYYKQQFTENRHLLKMPHGSHILLVLSVSKKFTGLHTQKSTHVLTQYDLHKQIS